MIHSHRMQVKYPNDFYLAGSAGHRIDAAWSIIHSDIRHQAICVLQRYPNGESSVEDLWAEAIVKLIEDDALYPKLPDGRLHAKIMRFRGLVKLINYCITIARRLAIQHYRKNKPQSASDEFLDTIGHNLDPQEQTLRKEQIACIQEVLRKAINSLSDEQRFLIVMVYREGMKQKEAAKMIGLSDFTANRRIKAAIKTIKDSIEVSVEGGKDLDLDVWQQVWDAAWPDSQ